MRPRPPAAVVDEIESLLAQGIDHLHTCDSEFNLPARHAEEVCREIIRRNLGDKLRWYAYCSPVPFPAPLARRMKQAGCAGINFGVDSGDESMLKRLGRDFTPEDILKSARLCRQEGIAVMLDLLLGAPGETQASIKNSVELVKKSGADRAGLAVGVRVYPGTRLASQIESESWENGLVGGGPFEPQFFLAPPVASLIWPLLEKLIGDDRTFFFFDSSRPERNYNYHSNQLLTDAIRRGFRGAYWDILRRADFSPP